jgi:hypothetical protein
MSGRLSAHGISWRIAIGLAIILILAGATIAYAAQHRLQKLTFRPFVAANPDPHGCLGAPGLYVDMIAYLKKPPKSVAEYNKLAATNIPTGANLTVGGSTYRLSLDRRASFVGNEQVGWEFRSIAVSKAVASSLIGKRAVFRYKIGSKSIATSLAVVDGRCKSLI